VGYTPRTERGMFFGEKKSDDAAPAEVESAPKPAVGCSCTATERPCPWCALTEEEREKLRNG
jgi:hypothetical protein